MFDGGDARGALVLEVAEKLNVVEVPEAVQVFNAASNGGGDGAGGEDRGDHGALNAEGLGKEGDGGIGDDTEEGRDDGIVHYCGSRGGERSWWAS